MRKFTAPPIQIGRSTHVGMRRSENQDSEGYAQLERLPYNGAHLLVLADGMGGASGGQVASRIAVKTVLHYFTEDNPNMEPDIAIREAIEAGAIAVAQKTAENPHLEGMGTTCVVVLVQNGYLFAGHIGDSRLYLYRDGVLHRLSRDHSAVQRLVEAGILTEEEAHNHPRQNVLARVLGSDQEPLVEVLAPPWKLQEGDRILLCSDGLHGEVEDEDIAEVLGSELPAQEASDKLVDMANKAGGNDNTTVQILSYGSQKPVEEEPEKWYTFENPTTGFLFHGGFLLLFFIWGYLTGKYDHKVSPPSPSSIQTAKVTPRNTKQTHKTSFHPKLSNIPSFRRLVVRKAPVVARKVPVVARKAPVVARKAPVVARKAPVVARKAPTTQRATSQPTKKPPKRTAKPTPTSKPSQKTSK